MDLHYTLTLRAALLTMILCPASVFGQSGQEDTTAPDWQPRSEWNLVEMENNNGSAIPVRAFKDKLYDGLFTRTRGWNGGDGVFTVGLPDGRVFWTFNDSFYGKVDGATRARKACNFPRNSVMVQTPGPDGLPGESDGNLVWLADYVNWTEPNSDKYFTCRTHLRHPLGEKSAEQIKNGDIDQNYVYWSGDGTVVDGKLQMIWFSTHTGNGDLSGLGVALATYSLEGEMPTGFYLDDLPDYKPQPGQYLHLESVVHDFNHNTVPYGQTLLEDEDGHTYLYPNNYFPVVARTATHDLSSPWQYYVKKDGVWEWQNEYPRDEELRKASNTILAGDRVMTPFVVKEGDYYYLIAQEYVFSRKVLAWRGKHPWGPFEHKRTVFTLPATLDKLGSDKSYRLLYYVNLHTALSRQGELVFSTNTDTEEWAHNFNDEGSADFYRPYFYRVFNWQHLWDDVVEEEFTEGDANGDGVVDQRDIDAVVAAIYGSKPEGFNQKAADMNRDNRLNVYDLQRIINIVNEKEEEK